MKTSSTPSKFVAFATLLVLVIATWFALSDSEGSNDVATHDVLERDAGGKAASQPLATRRVAEEVAVKDVEPAPPPPVEGEQFGSVAGTLITSVGTPVTFGTIYLASEVDVMQQDVDAEGRFRFGQVAPGAWLLGVLPDSIPGLIAPYGQSTNTGGLDIPEAFATRLLTVELGAALSRDIIVFLPTSIRGRVIDDRGEGVPGARVSARTNDRALAGIGLGAHGETDEFGNFAVEGLYPGAFSVAVSHVPPDSRAATLTRPERLALDLVAGETRSGIELQLIEGKLRLHGRVVDGWTGEPIAHHGVKSWYSKDVQLLGAKEMPRDWGDVAADVVTDAAGRFALHLRPDRHVKVGFTTSFNPNHKPGTGLAGYVDSLQYHPQQGVGRTARMDPTEHLKPRLWEEKKWNPRTGSTSATEVWGQLWKQRDALYRATPGAITTTADWIPRFGPEIDVGDIQVWPSRPYAVRGKVMPPAGVSLDEIRVTVTRSNYWLPSPVEFPHLHVASFQHVSLPVDDRGSFSWSTETPCGPVTITGAARGFDVVEYPITPHPGQVDEVVVTLH